MPGCCCAISGCKNNSVKVKISRKLEEGEDIIFHRFPRGEDIETVTLRNEWIQICNRANKFNPNTSHICSIHFTEDDYQRDLRNELLGLPIRRRLRKDAVPSLNLPIVTQEEESIENSEGLRKKHRGRRKKVIDELPNLPLREESNENINGIQSEDSNGAVEEIIVVCSDEYDELHQRYEKLKKQYDDYKKITQKKIQQLNRQLTNCKNKCVCQKRKRMKH